MCILNCCKVINNLLLNASIASNENPPGADEFLPVLIFVAIKVRSINMNLLVPFADFFVVKNQLVDDKLHYER